MKLKTIACTLAAAALMQMTAAADTIETLNVPSSQITGDTFPVQITINSDQNIGYMQAVLNYDDSIIEFVDGDAVGGGGAITVNTFPMSNPDQIDCVLNFRAVGEGYSDITLGNGYVFSPDGIVLAELNSTASVEVISDQPQQPDDAEDKDTPDAPAETVSQETESKPEDDSSEAAVTSAPDESVHESQAETQPETSQPEAAVVPKGYLASLSCDAGVLDPAFSYDVFAYTVYVDSDTENVKFNAVPSDTNDVITYSSDGKLDHGKNVRKITVTSDEGTETVYTVTVFRDEEGADSSSKSDSSDGKTERDKFKDLLNPALAIILVTLVVALFIVIMWIKSLGKNKKGKRKK
ncbi:cadherin-like beta sandwich domain-containing protein [Ruminococcus sp.]|uniref:cadherin-like beta sandwich domain-containing protein n=1 Tax=Ruminococcus sp. TaxID=41978 RepID=UPI0025EB3086|nr:cadherin-like beta sandwich domain-containing protein [Ruminococcus sp.]MBQ8965280.1 cadherin-like beta sandwich domain-containing protein [Ruminococcus sp.]